MTSIYDSSSESPCSSSSLAIPTLLLFDNQNSPIPSPVSIPESSTNNQQVGNINNFDKRGGEWRRRFSFDGTEGLKQNGNFITYRKDNEEIKQQLKVSSPLNVKVWIF
jgi:hypothetical protein